MDCARPFRWGRLAVMLAAIGWGLAAVDGGALAAPLPSAPATPEPVPTEPPPTEGSSPPPAAVTPLPSSAPPPGVAYAPGAPDPMAPAPAAAQVVVAVPDEPFYVKWWFWTAVGAFAVATVVILAASSDSGPPKTNLGNMPAF